MLDITPSAIEQLNYAECYPIVIYLKLTDRRLIKQIRDDYGKFYVKSSRRLLTNAHDLEYSYSYLFTSVLNFNSKENWLDLLKSQIDFEQDQPIWMNDDRLKQKDIFKSDEYFLSTNHSIPLKSKSLNSLFTSENPLMQTSTMSLPNRNQIYRANRYLTSRREGIQPNDRLSSSESNTSVQLKNEAEKPLEKPRVFIYDNRNVLSSSSTSSTLSFKEKILKEVGETQ